MIYLDNAATSFPKPEGVYQALDQFARRSLANPGRAGHRMALDAEHTLDQGRHRLNQFFHGQSASHWIFTLNGTDALNIAIKGILKPGDHVITSDLEHNSVSRPLRALEKLGVISLTRIAADEGGTIAPESIQTAITPKTKLIAITHASNVLGTVQPIAAIGKIAREKGVLFLVDGAQTAGVIPIDIAAMNIDLLALPGHKGLFSPTGVGVLYVRPDLVIQPWREGGTGGDSASETQPEDYPYYLEGGTPNVLGVAGLIAGLDYIEKEGLEKIHAHETQLTQYLIDQLRDLSGITIFGHQNMSQRVGTLSFQMSALAAVEIGGILDQAFEIAIRPGLHCSPYIHRSLGTFPDGLVRVSPGIFNTKEEIDQLGDALREITL